MVPVGRGGRSYKGGKLRGGDINIILPDNELLAEDPTTTRGGQTPGPNPLLPVQSHTTQQGTNRRRG
jgi:hypothetical protein